MPTQQRVDVASVLLARPQHVSAESLLEQVNQGDGDVSKATIYNTLRVFAEHGLLKEVIVEPSKTLYDSNTTPHHHFYDVDKGELIDIAVDDIVIGGLPQPPAGAAIQGVDVIVRVSRKK